MRHSAALLNQFPFSDCIFYPSLLASVYFTDVNAFKGDINFNKASSWAAVGIKPPQLVKG
jgi:hypothetical protein